MSPQRKRCCRCHRLKNLDAFHHQSSKKDGYDVRCKMCKKKWDHDRFANDIEGRKLRWVWRGIRNHQRRGIEVKISVKDLYSMAETTDRCPICDIVLDWSYKGDGKTRTNSPSLDRKENGATITKENTWIICNRCNARKNDQTFDEFVSFCSIIAQRFGPPISYNQYP